MVIKNWVDTGIFYKPDFVKMEWVKSHAQVPTGLVFDDKIRVYFATRDTFGQSRTTFVDLDNNLAVMDAKRPLVPVMQLGNPGEFDENGVMVGSIVESDGMLFMYYTGWRKTLNVPYLVSIGLAISTDSGETFQRYGNAPIIGISQLDPLMTMTPYVLKDENGWHMWFGSGIYWKWIKDKYEPVYLIKYGKSKDGKIWESSSKFCLDQSYAHESNVRPSIIKNGNIFEMYFCHRGTYDYRTGYDSYKVGRATSTDGINWQRDSDFNNFNNIKLKYASEMLAYPNIIIQGNEVIAFINGNNFGKSGFGILKGST